MFCAACICSIASQSLKSLSLFSLLVHQTVFVIMFTLFLVVGLIQKVEENLYAILPSENEISLY